MPIERRIKETGIVLVYVVVFWLLLPLSLWRIASYLDTRWDWMPSPSTLGWPLLLAGLAWIARAMLLLRQHGKGLPIGALPQQQLVQHGPYAVVCHPIYLGFNLALLGCALVMGSKAGTWIVAPAFLPCWVVYALLEERGLRKRFGETYRSYQRWVGILPRPPLYGLARLVARLSSDLKVEGREHLPKGPFVLIANHSCYLDPAYLMASIYRPIRFVITAQAYRNKAVHYLLETAHMIPVRRYRVDGLATRRLLEWLARGQIVGVFPEGERSVLGQYQGATREAAHLLAKVKVPVVPAAIIGAYDAGPRWSDRLRRRTITVRFGRALEFSGDAGDVVNRAMLGLLGDSKPILHLSGLPRKRLSRVVWACPRCSSDKAWQPDQLSCSHCGATFENTPDGLFRDEQGEVNTLAELGHKLLESMAKVETLTDIATGFHEADTTGPIKPLQAIPSNTLAISRRGLTFGELEIPLHTLRSITTERADTLQVATSKSMWQFRPKNISVFRIKAALDQWLQPAHLAPHSNNEGGVAGMDKLRGAQMIFTDDRLKARQFGNVFGPMKHQMSNPSLLIAHWSTEQRFTGYSAKLRCTNLPFS